MKNVTEFIKEFRKFLKKIFKMYDGIWVERLRKLNSELMFSAIISQTIERDGANYRLIYDKIIAAEVSCAKEFSASSYSKARRKLPFELFVDIAQWLYKVIEIPSAQKWLGMNVFAIDSTFLELPKELEKEGFDCLNDEDSDKPQAFVTALFDLQKGMIYDSILSQHGDERGNAKSLLPSLPDDSLLICDRGFSGFDFLYDAEKFGVRVLIRMPESTAPEELQEFIDSDSTDELITMSLSLPTERKLLRRGYVPRPVTVRAIKYFVGDNKYIAITTLMDEEICKKTFAAMYWCRWDIEEFFKLNKFNLCLQNFRSKHLQGILQEFWAMQVLINLARATIIATSGLKSKLKDRVEISNFGVLKLFRTHLFKILNSSLHNLTGHIDRFEKGLTKIRHRFRGGRHYSRKSKSWIPYTKGVSC